MGSSDEEGEILPECITGYHLVDYKEEAISFSALPIQWGDDESVDASSTRIFLKGSVDDGLQKFYKKVIAWKFDLSFVLPEIFALSKERMWIKLQRPWKSYENTVKSILVTIHFLHFTKKNPDASKDAMWNHLQKTFSSSDVEPSESDLVEHLPLIKEVATRDKEIAKSGYVAALLDLPGEMRDLTEDNKSKKRSTFIVDGDVEDEVDDDDYEDDDNESQLFDSVCALCDNGGELLCCEGRCIRSFHPTLEAGVESACESLGYTNDQVEAIQVFLCKNCQYQQHQCFVCGMLGSSNKTQGAEVFPCVSATCGHFYHPKCVAELLHPLDKICAGEVENKIAAGESFICPAHKCCVCKEGEDKKVHHMQFAMCRRCPKSYHRKCLPRRITFEGHDDFHQRAWDGLLPKRILIYCLDHKIIPKIGTPYRNHISFPDIHEERRLKVRFLSGNEKMVPVKRSSAYGSLTENSAITVKRNVQDAASISDGSTRKLDTGFSRQNTLTSLRLKVIPVQAKACKPPTVDKGKTRVESSISLPNMRLSMVNSKQHSPSGKQRKTMPVTSLMKKEDTHSLVDADIETRMMALIKRSTSSFNADEFIKKQKSLAQGCPSKFHVDKTITKGKIKGSVKAIRAALKKLKEGCSIEDAKAVCEPEVLVQIMKWKNKLSVYLAPFLIGTRYTSFGRHFTKVDKLKEITERLRWYVEPGDMIVDFCCGSNDFSLLMKEKLEQMGKRCSFKNFDLIQAKTDFNFEKRDWMSVGVNELPEGSQLIMGLNPPFGVQASLANKFIAKALKFRPKLLILIVPRETKRLDKLNCPYDLIWEDDKLLSGKSFYLPGSVDVHDQQLDQWNLEAPPLYLWSRPDWTAKHKAIAQSQGHLPKDPEQQTNGGGQCSEPLVNNYLMEENHDCYVDFSADVMKGCGDNISRILDDVPEDCCPIDEMQVDMELSTP